MIKYFLLSLSFALGLSACQTPAANFVAKSPKTILHRPTGIEYPSVISGWENSLTQVNENLSPEILAELTYTMQSPGREFQPRASVFFMKGASTANLQLIENKEAIAFQKAEKIKTDLGSNIPSKQKVLMSSYSHSLSQTVEVGGASVVKEVPLSSLFVQSAKKPQLVFLLTTSAKQVEDQKVVLKLMDDFLIK